MAQPAIFSKFSTNFPISTKMEEKIVLHAVRVWIYKYVYISFAKAKVANIEKGAFFAVKRAKFFEVEWEIFV